MTGLYVALDTTDIGVAEHLARQLAGHVDGLKLGLEFLHAHGPQVAKPLAEHGLPLFFDVKLHDIPNTVAGGIRALVPHGPTLINVHTQGGAAMMQAAAEAARSVADSAGIVPPKVLGVTILTSLGAQDLADMGVPHEPADQVVRLACLAQQSGLDGVVCSPHEIAAVRKVCGPDFMTVVPGIRPASAAVGDQKRVMTPAQAQAEGAHYIVVGRPITQADDPAAAAAAIKSELESD